MSFSAQDDSQAQQNKEYKLLLGHKKDVLSHLSSVELITLSEELRDSKVISPEVTGLFAELDQAMLKPKLRLRYLVHHVYEAVRHNGAVFLGFLGVLEGCGRSVEELARYLSKEWSMPKKAAGPEETVSSQAVGYDRSFLEDDIPYLMKILIEVSHKWKELGIALGFTETILDKCRAEGNNTLRLHKLLCEWIKGNCPRAATLKDLKEKLAGDIVGAANIAYCLEKKFWKAKSPEPIIVVECAPGLSTGLRITNQSYHTEVPDGRSTLLEVQVSDGEGASYLWRKEGQALTDSLRYSGSQTPILVIRQARQVAQGEYTCHISKGSEEVLISDAVLLTVIFSPEKKHLTTLYAQYAHVPEDSWPPKVNSTFINLALIKKKKEITHAYQYSLRGDVDDILETKEMVEYDTVFGEYKSGSLVLVEGRPGSGKTTLVHKVSRDWATGGEVLMSAKLVIHIPLRQLANRKTKDLSDVLEVLYFNRKAHKNIVSAIEEANGEGTCFILDGLDEFHPPDETKSMIHQLLYQKYLPAAMVIVTSRPVATDTLRHKQHVTRRIEVFGFSHQQILEYIDNYPFTSDTSNISPSQLKAYLNSHPNLLHICYLPINVAMICFLYEGERGIIPQTETKIYEHFTQYIVLRNLRRTNEKAVLDSLDHLHGKNKECFNKICELALDMTAHSRQSVCQRETQVQLPLGTGPDDVPTLGLITIERTADLQRLDNRYTFLHLTFQVFLAALYLAQLQTREQKKIIKLYGGEKLMQMVWKFYFGIVKFENKVSQIQHIIRSACMEPGQANLYAAQCAFESQQQVVCDNIVKESLSYKNCTLTLADVTAVCYVISTTSHHVTNLDMAYCNLHDEHIRTLLEKISTNKLNFIKAFHFHGNKISEDGSAALSAGLKSCHKLRTLYLDSNNISAVGTVALAAGLKSCHKLHTLTLGYNNISDVGSAALAAGLKSCHKLQRLYLGNNNISDVGIAALAAVLKSCHKLKILHLNNNRINDIGSAALAAGLKSCHKLHILLLYNNNISDRGADALAVGLKSCHKLHTLYLYNNNISAKAGAALIAQLKCPDLWL